MVSSDCTTSDCQGIATFDISESNSLNLTSTDFHLDYLIGSVSGTVGTDTVTFGPYEISSQVFGQYNPPLGEFLWLRFSSSLSE